MDVHKEEYLLCGRGGIVRMKMIRRDVVILLPLPLILFRSSTDCDKGVASGFDYQTEMDVTNACSSVQCFLVCVVP